VDRRRALGRDGERREECERFYSRYDGSSGAWQISICSSDGPRSPHAARSLGPVSPRDFTMEMVGPGGVSGWHAAQPVVMVAGGVIPATKLRESSMAEKSSRSSSCPAPSDPYPDPQRGEPCEGRDGGQATRQKSAVMRKSG
jgi:hypothetical protein